MLTLNYVYDPMCSWCYAFAPTWKRISNELPVSVSVEYVVGGLASDSDHPMSQEMCAHIEGIWRHILEVVPNTEFNFDFWTRCEPRRSTYPACRAVLAAKHFDPKFEAAMIDKIQVAYYREARNPSDIDTLCELAAELGIEVRFFREFLTGERCEAILKESFQKRRNFGVRAFPTLVLESIDGSVVVPHDFSDPLVTLNAIAVAQTTDVMKRAQPKPFV